LNRKPAAVVRKKNRASIIIKLPLPMGMGPTWNTFGMRSVFVAANRQHSSRDQHAAAKTTYVSGSRVHQQFCEQNETAEAAAHFQRLHHYEAAPAVGHGANVKHLRNAQRLRGCSEQAAENVTQQASGCRV
jgi:hypothetical protein